MSDPHFQIAHANQNLCTIETPQSESKEDFPSDEVFYYYRYDHWPNATTKGTYSRFPIGGLPYSINLLTLRFPEDAFRGVKQGTTLFWAANYHDMALYTIENEEIVKREQVPFLPPEPYVRKFELIGYLGTWLPEATAFGLYCIIFDLLQELTKKPVEEIKSFAFVIEDFHEHDSTKELDKLITELEAIQIEASYEQDTPRSQLIFRVDCVSVNDAIMPNKIRFSSQASKMHCWSSLEKIADFILLKATDPPMTNIVRDWSLMKDETHREMQKYLWDFRGFRYPEHVY